MAGPSNSLWLDDEICDELWNENEFSDDSDCYGDMAVKFLTDSEQSDSPNKDNVNDDSDMQHETWTKVRLSDPVFHAVV
jgi:hypothetical protein